MAQPIGAVAEHPDLPEPWRPRTRPARPPA